MMHRSPLKYCQRGAAAIEFGLLMLPLATLTLGITEFGRAFHQFNTVAKNVRDAARYQSTVAAGDTLGGRCLALTGFAANSNNACTVTTPLLPGLTLAQVSVCDRLSCPSTNSLQPFPAVAGGGGGTLNLVTVTITGYQFTSMASFAVPTITFGAIQATMVQPL